MSDWRRVPLSDVVTRVTTKNVKGTITNVLTVSAEHGLVPQDSFFTKKIASANTTGYYVVAPGQFVYNKSTSKSATYGTIARNLDDKSGIVSPLYFVFEAKTTAALPEYLELALNSNNFFGSLAGLLREGARSHGALNVRLGEFYAATVALPRLHIQRRIVEIVGAIDKQISTLESESAAMRRIYLSTLATLGAHGKEVSIEEVVTKAFAGGTPSRARADFYGGEIPWLKSGEVDNDGIVATSESITEQGLLGSSARMVQPGAVVVAMYGQGDTKGRAGLVEVPLTTNQAVLALVPDQRLISPRFLLYAIRSKTDELRTRAAGSSQPNLSKALVLSQKIPILTALADQREAVVVIDAIRLNQMALRAEASCLRQLRSALLSGLLNGTVDIEPAASEV